MNDRAGWGPSHQTGRSGSNPVVMIVLLVVLVLLAGKIGLFWILAPMALIVLARIAVAIHERRAARRGGLPAGVADSLAAVRERALRDGGGVYLGLDKDQLMRFARSQRAVLLLGPPRSGKTSAVIIPAVIADQGPAVCTSTKTDVAASTWPARQQSGRLWVFDPTGSGEPSSLRELRWSPIRCAGEWDGALLMARAMTAGANVGAGTVHGSHWAKRAQALLAPFLHAAAIDGRDMESVVDWVMRHELDPAGIILEQEQASRLAFGSLLGLLNTEDRERASIFSAAGDALEAYLSEAALRVAKDPNFDPAQFVASADTVYIHAPAEEQAAAAPLVCGLLAEIRRAAYLAHRRGALTSGRVFFALDEAANIAPLEELPAIASEGGGQGLTLLAAFQDLSQARGRWGPAADGFLTLFGTKLILPGIADTRTLEAISTALGEYDRKMVSTSTVPSHDRVMPRKSRTVSTQRTRVLSPGEIANIPASRGLHLDGLRWELLTLTPAHATEPWKTLTTPPASER